MTKAIKGQPKKRMMTFEEAVQLAKVQIISRMSPRRKAAYLRRQRMRDQCAMG